ncbi:MAG: hydrogenase [Candidatus Omnitrophica bacterium]|nr:hydrogenase [Candidatus Omnitrophota bacterium]
MLLFLILLPFSGGLLAFVLPKNSLRKILLIGVASIHLAAVLGLWSGGMPDNGSGPVFLGLDVLGKLILTVISILFAAVSVYLWGYLKNERACNRIFTGCLLLLLSSMTLVSVSAHMGLLWVALEATTLMSAPLISFERSPQNTEAAWKYVLICSVGIALALLGTIMLAISSGNFKTVFLNDLLNHASVLTPSWLKLSVIFLLVGYGTKMGLAPMHTWKPDAYAQSPAPIGGLLSGALTACPILAILRVVQICNRADLSSFIEPILMVMGVLSLGVAAVFILRQKDFSRMLAYSSVENMGIIALGLGLGQAAYWPSMFHLINNALTKGFMFMLAGNLYQHYRSRDMGQIQGVYAQNALMGVLLVLGFMSLTAIPPSGTFFSEIMILSAAVQSKHYLIAAMFIVFLSVIFIGMAKGALQMFHHGPASKQESSPMVHPVSSMAPILVLGAIILALGLHVPVFLENVLRSTQTSLGGR